jgi:hypothetical protein
MLTAYDHAANLIFGHKIVYGVQPALRSHYPPGRQSYRAAVLVAPAISGHVAYGNFDSFLN